MITQIPDSGPQVRKTVFYLLNKYSGRISRLEAEILLSYTTKCPREDLYVSRMVIDDGTERVYDSLVERRFSGEPLEHITGSVNFSGLDFMVDKDVFIPRPETESLIREVLRYAIGIRNHPRDRFRVLDLCTGSGNIAITLARSMPEAKISAVDISEHALSVAFKNARLHNVDRNVRFYNADIFEGLPFDKDEKFDIIVCNPPYVIRGDIDMLQEEVKRESRIALDGGEDGLDFYRRLEELCPGYLKDEGALFLELGLGQAEKVSGIFKKREKLFEIRKIIKDFSGIDRVLWIDLS